LRKNFQQKKRFLGSIRNPPLKMRRVYTHFLRTSRQNAVQANPLEEEPHVALLHKADAAVDLGVVHEELANRLPIAVVFPYCPHLRQIP